MHLSTLRGFSLLLLSDLAGIPEHSKAVFVLSFDDTDLKDGLFRLVGTEGFFKFHQLGFFVIHIQSAEGVYFDRTKLKSFSDGLERVSRLGVTGLVVFHQGVFDTSLERF